MVTFGCGNCGAGLAFDGVRTATCPYCASPNFVERPPAAGQPRSEVRRRVHRRRRAARSAQLDRWLGSRHAGSPTPRSRARRVEDLRGVYVPAYLYSAVAHTDYTASIGEHYTETESYETTDDEGNKKTETRTVTRTEYRPLSGTPRRLRHRRRGQRVARACRTRELARDRAVRPAAAAPLLAGADQRAGSPRSSRATPTTAGGRAATRRSTRSGSRLRRFMPGDSHSDLAWRTSVDVGVARSDPRAGVGARGALSRRQAAAARRDQRPDRRDRPARCRSRGGRSRSRRSSLAAIVVAIVLIASGAS